MTETDAFVRQCPQIGNARQGFDRPREFAIFTCRIEATRYGLGQPGSRAAPQQARVPIWLGGRTEGDIEQADAALEQRKAELEDVRGHIENDIRSALLDLQAAARQVEVAGRNLEVTRQTLELTQQRLQEGVAEHVEVIQAPEFGSIQ